MARLVIGAAWPLFVATVTTCFNLEPRIAIVKYGEPESYFGFSVSQHQIVSQDRLESLLLVGAPLALSTEQTQPGTVFKCPITTETKDCMPIETVMQTRKSKPKYLQKLSEESDGQWMGTVVQSQGKGKQVIVCAHRHVQQPSADQRWGHGKCFTLNQNLKHSATWDPCEGREKNRAHEQWGYCQAGTSALLTEDNMALIGAPGPFTWRGTVFAVSVEEDFLFRDKTHYHTPVKEGNAPVDKYSYLGMSLAAGNFLPDEEMCTKTTLSSSSGSSFSQSAIAYAAGAPRAGGTGRVLISVKCDSSEILRTQRILHGDNFASSFGYALAAADINGDGKKDLFVGAPFYHKKGAGGAVYFYRNGDAGLVGDSGRKMMVGSEESRFGFSLASAGDINNDGVEDLVMGAPYDEDGGKVFVFMGRGGGGDVSFSKADQVISGGDIPLAALKSNVPLQTFGYSLAGGIDMDLNNHSDVAVGAFESDAAIVIRSRPVIDIVTWFGKHPHRINPDQQGCESDLYSPQVCFVIESCFLIKNFPSNIDTTYIRYVLEADTFTGGGGRRPVPRIRFGDHHSNSSHLRENIIPIQRNSLTGCFPETGYLREGASDLTTPITFQLSLSLEQDEPRPFSERSRDSGVPNINQFPILNQQEARREVTIPFQKSCGGDELCNSFLSSKLEIVSSSPATVPHQRHSSAAATPSYEIEIQDRQEIVIHVNVENSGEPAYAAVMLLDIDPSFTYVGRSDNHSDINCQLESKTKTAGYQDRHVHVGEGSTENFGTIVRCDLGNPYNGQRADMLVFRVLPVLSGRISQNVYFTTSVFTTSEDLNLNSNYTVSLRVIKRAEVSIRSSIQPENIWYGGAVIGESAMKVMSDIGSKVSHTFQVTNDGPWNVEQAEVVINWPYQLGLSGHNNHASSTDEPGKWLLYLSEPPEVTPRGLGSCFLNPRMVNHLGLRELRSRNFYSDTSQLSYSAIDSAGRGRLRRRSTDETFLDLHRATRLHCADDRTKCQTINCRIWQLRANESAVIRIRSRIWNATLVEEFSYGHDAVAVEANARVVLTADMAEHQDGANDFTRVALIGFPAPGGPGAPIVVPTWVILVAVALGLLVVGVIAVILHKIGFFKRRRVDDEVDGDDEDGEGDSASLYRGRDDLMISAKLQQQELPPPPPPPHSAAIVSSVSGRGQRTECNVPTAAEYMS